jgi:potassium channel LctB
VSSHAGERLGVRAAHAAIAAREKALGVIGRFLDRVASLSFNRLIAIWGAGVLGCGALYWMIEAVGGAALIEAGTPLPATARGFVSSVYFSFVTATSLGYGDIVPVGLSRFVAILEGAGGLLLFGCVISKLVSHRQEILIEEIHRSAFESRLSRVRTNLHLMLSELQGLAAETAEGTIPLERLGARLESAAMVFGGELRSVHDLLYRPQQAPDEEALEALLANLAAGLREFCDLMDALPQARERSEILHTGITSIAMLASEICGECVPREYAPGLKIWMDRIQQLARRLSTA